MKTLLLMMMLALILFSVACGEGGFRYNGQFWQVGPDRDISWNEAKEWVDGLGGNWRMPTRSELQSLWDSGISSNYWGSFENSGYSVWSGEVEGPSSAWAFDFNYGNDYWIGRSSSHNCGRAFAVRCP